MTQSFFTSPTREKYGISCKEARQIGLIVPATKLKFDREGCAKSVQDGWECVITGLRYPTQEQAVAAHFSKVSQDAADKNTKAKANVELFNIFREEIQVMGFLTTSLRQARNNVFTFEEAICCKYEADSDRDIRISAYTGMIESLKNT